MAQIKAYEFDRKLGSPELNKPIILVYGPDRGLVSERALTLAKKTGIDPEDAFGVMRLNAAEFASEPGRLIDEARSVSMFGGDRLIWVKGAGNDKGLIQQIDDLMDNPPVSTFILIEAGDLKKGSGLRKVIENSKNAVAVPCYADDRRDLNDLLDRMLGSANLRISMAARQNLLDQIGGDRLATRGEIDKLVLYCLGKDEITELDVDEIIGDASTISADQAVDAVLAGNLEALDHAIEKLCNSKTSTFLALLGAMRQFQLLDLMRGEIESGRLKTNQAMGTLGRGVHFKRKPVFEAALKTWTSAAINAALNHFQKAILQSRQQPFLQDSIARQALIAAALRSRRKSNN